ncbi:YggS family pyridoxal phosphate-dependent enzyme [Alphaproteobacteria bacterium]|nr:YggS family pyridoxal phosphate-dependent enzyme [Alphaproteobacteria bacterium]
MGFNENFYSNLKNSVMIDYSDCRIMVVTKNRPIDLIQKSIDCGQRLFGENKVQEASIKFTELRKEHNNLDVHLIGPLQTNKTKLALETFDTIQSIDREKLINEIIKKRTDLDRAKDFFIQVNIGEEKQKSGINPADLENFYKYCITNKVNIKGLMCIPPNGLSPDPFFRSMINLKNKINNELQLSMGMSGDYMSALKIGSNLIRIGSAFFNE